MSDEQKPDEKINYRDRFTWAIRRLRERWNRDLHFESAGSWIYVREYRIYDPVSPYTSQFHGYKKAAEHFEQLLAELETAEAASGGI